MFCACSCGAADAYYHAVIFCFLVWSQSAFLRTAVSLRMLDSIWRWAGLKRCCTSTIASLSRVIGTTSDLTRSSWTTSMFLLPASWVMLSRTWDSTFISVSTSRPLAHSMKPVKTSHLEEFLPGRHRALQEAWMPCTHHAIRKDLCNNMHHHARQPELSFTHVEMPSEDSFRYCVGQRSSMFWVAALERLNQTVCLGWNLVCMPQVYNKLLSKGVMQSILFANTEAGGTKVLQLLYRKQVFGTQVDTKTIGNACTTRSQIEQLLILEWGCLSGQSNGVWLLEIVKFQVPCRSMSNLRTWKVCTSVQCQVLVSKTMKTNSGLQQVSRIVKPCETSFPTLLWLSITAWVKPAIGGQVAWKS